MNGTDSPYLDKRDFRAILFSSERLRTLSGVAELFDGQSSIDGRKDSELSGFNGAVNGVRVRYYSKTCFLRTSDSTKRHALRDAEKSTKTEDVFKYDVYVLSYKSGSGPVFMVAVPFANMAREVFGKIHDRIPDKTFEYLKPELGVLVDALKRRRSGTENIRAVGINWAIAGDTGRADQITVRGSDVVHSRVSDHLDKSGAGLKLSLRRIQIRYASSSGSEILKLSFDKFGNYGVWVTGRGGNLPAVFEVFEVLKKTKIIEGERTFPVRNRDEEPLLP